MRSVLAAVLLLLTQATLAQVDAISVDADSQSITISLTQELPQLNGVKATDQVSILILSHAMEGLVRYDRRGNIVPGVAERWEMNDQTVTFWLR